jgi:hypothetical protein
MFLKRTLNKLGSPGHLYVWCLSWPCEIQGHFTILTAGALEVKYYLLMVTSVGGLLRCPGRGAPSCGEVCDPPLFNTQFALEQYFNICRFSLEMADLLPSCILKGWCMPLRRLSLDAERAHSSHCFMGACRVLIHNRALRFICSAWLSFLGPISSPQTTLSRDWQVDLQEAGPVLCPGTDR